MGQFRWIAVGEIPSAMDLRRQGWALAAHDSTPEDGCVVIVHATGMSSAHWRHLIQLTRHEERRSMLVGSANSPDERARLLAQGFGDAVSDDTSIEELEARARRLSDLARWVPKRRVMATLELDLLSREATFAGTSLNLHPREFELLWRLADTPETVVDRETLFRDVWRLGSMPENNSIAVHMSRLRRKLKAAGLVGLIETADRGYRLRCAILDTAAPSSWMRGLKVPPGIAFAQGAVQ